MPEHIPISAAQGIAASYGCRQVVLVAWDGERTHVVTFGASESDSDQAARGGNFVKRALGWPKRLCHAESLKVLRLRSRIQELEAAVKASEHT